MSSTPAYKLLIFDWEGTLMDSSGVSAPFDGVLPVLTVLQDAGYLLAVATGKSRRGLDADLMHHAMESFFVATACGDEGFSKPHPGMLLEILDVTGVEKQAALMIGDTRADLLMAQAAEVDALAVTYGLESRENLLALNPRGYIDDIIDLPFWLKKTDRP